MHLTAASRHADVHLEHPAKHGKVILLVAESMNDHLKQWAEPENSGATTVPITCEFQANGS